MSTCAEVPALLVQAWRDEEFLRERLREAHDRIAQLQRELERAHAALAQLRGGAR